MRLLLNALIILLADRLIDRFSISSVWSVIVFNDLLSVLQSILHSLFKEQKK
ncbi:hypothetical protein J1C55_04225 [Winogradskyella sp. E313]|uniref:Uncharacterized protein n=1 Tax=Winogradskyella immobilis TaxID=2816852 RepID=A0ABS8EKP0_9FLAO|nr:hypothetical protein [Winogradskyella immobilis]MCG0015883.1 hypothetical protein [Winogradskyella immobilis]